MYFKIVVALLLTLLLGVNPEQASAGFSFCNKSGVLHSFSVAYKDGEKWRSEGWWNIEPGDCKRVISGDLRVRYYYYRATAKGREFSGDNYFFCTLSSVFDIVGEQGNCANRGYDRSEFRQIKLDQGITDFTLNLVPPKGKSHDAALQQKAGLPRQGTHGEPYSTTGIFQDCVTDTEARHCTFHANGAKIFVYDDGRTPERVMSFFYSQLPGQPIEVSGDMTGVYDATADAVIYEARRMSPDTHARLLEKMQGGWYSADDMASQFTIIGAERENSYDGQFGSTEYLTITNQCDDGPPNAGPFLIAREPETGEAFCYAIDQVSQLEMTLFYMPRGNMLRYRRLD